MLLPHTTTRNLHNYYGGQCSRTDEALPSPANDLQVHGVAAGVTHYHFMNGWVW